jgi:surface carbohydrate biosynthesis protein
VLQPIVYLTCEIKGRDLDSRALIAAHLVKKGYTAVLGQYWNLHGNAPVAPQGCYFFKTSNRIQAQGMQFCKQYGHIVIASDEEAISSPESLAATATDGLTFDACDLFLALHEGHKRALLKAFPNAQGNVRVAGTARADILRCVDYPRPYDAPYVLFNTSFGVLNSIWKNFDLALAAYRKGISRLIPAEEQEEIIQARVEYERASFEETRLLLGWFSRRHGIDVILRPHPGEDAGFWRTAHSKRIKVVENSDAYPWIQHAKLIVHSDSTTGLEAAIMGTPSVNLSPLDIWAKRLVLRDINYSPRSAAEAQPAIEEFLATSEGPIAAASGGDPFPLTCGEKIAAAIASYLPPPRDLGSIAWPETPRGEPQKQKFTVSPEEFRVSLRQMFDLAGQVPYEVTDLADSVVLIRPRAAAQA